MTRASGMLDIFQTMVTSVTSKAQGMEVNNDNTVALRHNY